MIRTMRTALAAGLVLGALAACSNDEPGDFCTLAGTVEDAQAEVDRGLSSGDPAEIERTITAAIAAGRDAVSVAPPEIADDARAAVDGQDELARILADYDWDLTAASADPDLGALMSDQEVAAANDRLETYLFDECGIAPAGGSASSTTGSSSSSGATVTTELLPPDQTLLELSAEVGGTTVGTEDQPGAVFAAVLTNETDVAASNLSINFTMYDAEGKSVGAATGYVDLLLPGASRAITGSQPISGPASRIEANYTGDVGLPFGVVDADLPQGTFTFSNEQLVEQELSTGVTALLSSSFSIPMTGVEISVVFRDESGAIVGGAIDTVDIGANGSVQVEPTMFDVVPGVASFDLYAAYSVYGLGD